MGLFAAFSRDRAIDMPGAVVVDGFGNVVGQSRGFDVKAFRALIRMSRVIDMHGPPVVDGFGEVGALRWLLVELREHLLRGASGWVCGELLNTRH